MNQIPNKLRLNKNTFIKMKGVIILFGHVNILNLVEIFNNWMLKMMKSNVTPNFYQLKFLFPLTVKNYQ